MESIPRPSKAGVNLNVSKILVVSDQERGKSGYPGLQAKGANHLETPLRQLHAFRGASCAKQGGHRQLCSKSVRDKRGAA